MKLTTIQHQQPLDHLAPAGRVGVISLATDFNIETDLKRMYPDQVGFFTSRVRNYNPLTLDNLRLMAPGISAAADTILPGTDLDVMIYACTSGTVAIGQDKVVELIHASRPGVKVTTPVSAVDSALQQFGAKRISILTPYTENVNQGVAEVFGQQGYDVLSIAGFGFEDDTAMTFISPEDIARAAVESCDPKAEVMFLSCTALRASVVIEQIEQQLGIPVISSNQALVWHSLKLMNYTKPVPGFGCLLSQYLALKGG